jgi:formamidopyrimidine-DNA glycosylase
MPELPDVELYLGAIADRTLGHELTGIRFASPFLLRSVDPPVREVVGRKVTGVRRLGKRVVLALEGERFLVVHLMIAGRFAWADAPGRRSRGGSGWRPSTSTRGP